MYLLPIVDLQATSMTRSGLSKTNLGNQMSDIIWSTLRMTILMTSFKHLHHRERTRSARVSYLVST